MIFEESAVLSRTFTEALAEVKAAFASVGFGTLTEIDMQATLKAKIDKDIDPYVIVGACNPKLASRALEIDPQIGVLLPCNVVVRQFGDYVMVEAMDPGLMASITGNDDIAPIAAEARELVSQALSHLMAPPELPPESPDASRTSNPCGLPGRPPSSSELHGANPDRFTGELLTDNDRTGRFGKGESPCSPQSPQRV